MKIYFCGSMRGGRQDVELYRRLIAQLKVYGEILTEHVGFEDTVLDKMEADDTDKYFHDKDVQWLQESDVVVAEVTQPSLGVGYEIGRAVDMKKRILCLYRPSSDRDLSLMIRGAENGREFLVKDYEEAESANIFKEFFSES